MQEETYEESLKTKMVECSRINISSEDYQNLCKFSDQCLNMGAHLSYILYLIAADRDSVRKPNIQLHHEILLKEIKTCLFYHEEDSFSEMKEGAERFSIGEASFELLKHSLSLIQVKRLIQEGGTD